MRKLFTVIMFVVMIAGLLSGCAGGASTSDGELAPLGKDEQVKIKVMFWDSNYFFQEYGNLFATKFPNIEIEVVNMQSIYSDQTFSPDKALDKFVEENKPDILMLQGDQYEKYAANGKLFALDSVIEQDEFNMEGMHPAILKLLREQGNGKLYGLAPDFSSSAIFYNEDLFKKHGVELPKDSMSWEEVFELAKRFPTDGEPDKRIYGLTTDNYMTLENFIYSIGAAQDLKILNADSTQLNVNTDSWRKVFQSAVDVVKSGAYYVPTDKDRETPMMINMEDLYNKNLFIMGRSAMTFKYSYEVNTIIQAKEQLKKELNWGVVTAPVDPNNRNQSSYFSLGNTFSVNANSPNLRAAWEFVKYINSEEFAKIKSRSSNGSLMTWTAYNGEKDGRSLEAFYKLEPKSNTNNEFAKAPPNFFGGLFTVIKSEIDAVIADKKTVDEALQSIQEDGQKELIKAKQAAEAAETASPSPSSSEAASPSASTEE